MHFRAKFSLVLRCIRRIGGQLHPLESAIDFTHQPVRESRERKIRSGVRGGDLAENEFGAFLASQDSWSDIGGTMTAPP